MEKTCTKCNIYKNLSDFYFIKSKGIYFSICKKCTNIKSIEYAKNHPELKKDIDRKYYNNHKEEIKKKNKDYRLNNKDNYNNWYKNKYNNDINYKIGKLLRSRLYELIKKTKNNTSNTSSYIIGCTTEMYKNYLELQFKPEMNWNNHGEIWEIDHIIPCNSFNLNNIEEQKQCFHYTNTQPLFKTTKIAESFGYNETGNKDKGGKI
jgi:hypothetical protein